MDFAKRELFVKLRRGWLITASFARKSFFWISERVPITIEAVTVSLRAGTVCLRFEWFRHKSEVVTVCLRFGCCNQLQTPLHSTLTFCLRFGRSVLNRSYRWSARNLIVSDQIAGSHGRFATVSCTSRVFWYYLGTRQPWGRRRAKIENRMKVCMSECKIKY